MWGYKTAITIDHFLIFLKIFQKIQFRTTKNEVKTTNLVGAEFELKLANDLTMPISSQAPKEFGEGSETRVDDPERVMELHERMAKLKEYLFNQLDANEQLIAEQSLNLLYITIDLEF